MWALVRGNAAGWTSFEVAGTAALGMGLLAGFVAWELRAKAPMLPMRFFRNRTFAAANAASVALCFGVFGSMFLITQFFQLVLGYSPLEAGVRILPWMVMPLLVAPVAGALSDRIGGRPLMVFGLLVESAALAWMAGIAGPELSYGQLVPALVLAGIGMPAFFAPVTNVVMGSVRPEEAGKASGATNAIRELGGVLGVAVLAAVFAGRGGYETPAAFVDGYSAALAIAAVVLAVGAVACLLVPDRRSAGLTLGSGAEAA